jgi:crotonobetainyl-CoA:carnitine CoA-transferase CaiB-like acyl-CoA transferase
MPAFGTNGRWRGYRAYGSTVEQASGLPHLNGEPDWPPTMQHVALGDAVGGINGAAAALTALVHRARSGRGQYADLSQAECLFPLGAHGIVEQSLHGRPPSRRGSRRDDACPSGAFPCAGDDAWVVIQVQRAAEWQALCDAAGRPDLRSLDLAARRAREPEIEALLAGWTRQRTPAEAMHALQAVGVPAAAAHGAGDLLVDPHLAAREFWQFRERAFVGRSPNPSAPYRFSSQPLSVAWPAPTLGQHNARVLGDLLGLATSELESLTSAQIIGTRPIVGATPGAG